MRNFLLLVLLLAIIGGSYWAFTHFRAGGDAGQHAGEMGGPGGPPPTVSVAQVIERDVQPWQEFSGRLVAVNWVEIRPQVSGTIEKVHFKESDWVERGAALFTIDQRPYEAAMQAAQARFTLAQSELERAKSLLSDKALAQRDYDQRKNDRDVAQAELTRAKLDYDHSVIKAPFTGRVGRAEITPGNVVDAGGGAPVLATLVADKPIYADFDIDEQSYLTYLQDVGADREKIQEIPVAIALANEPGAPTHQGRVQSFDNQLNVRSGTIRVRTIFGNEDGKLIPGLYARVRLGGAEKRPAILVSDRAIGTDQSRKFVIVVGEGGVTERRVVKLGGEVDGLRIVTEGLKPGEKIVVSGLQRIMMPGQPVTPETVDMQAPPPELGQGPPQ